MAADAENLHAVVAVIGSRLNGREIRDHIRRDIAVRVAHFVEKLFFDRLNIYASAGAGMLGNDKLTVWAKPRRSGNRRSPGPEYSANRTGNFRPSLRAAFDNMPGDGSRRDPVPIVETPSRIHASAARASARYRSSRPPTTICAPLVQSFDQRRRAQVNIGALHFIADRRERFAGLHVVYLDASVQKFIQPREEYRRR